MNELNRIKERQKTINLKLLCTYAAGLISIQAIGLFFLFHNLSFYSALTAAMALGFLTPILFGLVFVEFSKRLEERLDD